MPYRRPWLRGSNRRVGRTGLSGRFVFLIDAASAFERSLLEEWVAEHRPEEVSDADIDCIAMQSSRRGGKAQTRRGSRGTPRGGRRPAAGSAARLLAPAQEAGRPALGPLPRPPVRRPARPGPAAPALHPFPRAGPLPSRRGRPGPRLRTSRALAHRLRLRRRGDVEPSRVRGAPGHPRPRARRAAPARHALQGPALRSTKASSPGPRSAAASSASHGRAGRMQASSRRRRRATCARSPRRTAPS